MKKIKTWADKNLQGDRVIWAVVFALSLISILVVYSSIGTLAYKRTQSPESFLIKHTITWLSVCWQCGLRTKLITVIIQKFQRLLCG